MSTGRRRRGGHRRIEAIKWIPCLIGTCRRFFPAFIFMTDLEIKVHHHTCWNLIRPLQLI